MKERITITIEESLLKTLDKRVDGVTIKNRSHAIELILSKSIKGNNITTALVLAGGPYEIEQNGETTPTLMVKINNKPILEHNILMLKKQGITNILLIVGHKKELIKEYFNNGEAQGVEITYIEEDKPHGTAGVLKLASEYITEPFVVVNGDELKKIDVREMYDFHRKQGTLATMALTTSSDPQHYGVVVLNGNRVYSFIEKPKGRIPSNLINAGLYIFEPEVLNEAPQGYGRLEEDVFPKLAQKEELAGYVFYGEWQDVRDTTSLQRALKEWQQHMY